MEAAEEITQSVFVTVATKLSQGEYAEQGRFESWLFRVAMNRVRDEARRSMRLAGGVGSEGLDGQAGSGGSSAERLDQHAALERLSEAINELPEADRDIIQLRHHAGMSFKQMAELLDEPLGTLLARHHRALRKLKQLLEAEGEKRGDQA